MKKILQTIMIEDVKIFREKNNNQNTLHLPTIIPSGVYDIIVIPKVKKL